MVVVSAVVAAVRARILSRISLFSCWLTARRRVRSRILLMRMKPLPQPRTDDAGVAVSRAAERSEGQGVSAEMSTTFSWGVMSRWEPVLLCWVGNGDQTGRAFG